MNLILAGVSHKTAPLEVRERFAFSEQGVSGALRRLQAEPEIEEAAIISTCNRVEFILESQENQDGLGALRRFLESSLEIRYDEYAHCFYVHRDYEAVRHLFRVASSLDSMVVGETEITGQVKNAYQAAQTARSACPARHVLHELEQRRVVKAAVAPGCRRRPGRPPPRAAVPGRDGGCSPPRRILP